MHTILLRPLTRFKMGWPDAYDSTTEACRKRDASRWLGGLQLLQQHAEFKLQECDVRDEQAGREQICSPGGDAGVGHPLVPLRNSLTTLVSRTYIS